MDRVVAMCLMYLIGLFMAIDVQAGKREDSALTRLELYNVSWNSPSGNSKGSMPLGNGDIGLNVWVENGGDLLFYIGKTDAWSERVHNPDGLLKVGLLRFHFERNPFAGQQFRQTLNLRKSRIEITSGENHIKVWVDANNPLVRFEASCSEKNSLTVTYEPLRSPENIALRKRYFNSVVHTDSILKVGEKRIGWFYKNANMKQKELVNLTFGALVEGTGMRASTPVTLQSTSSSKSFQVTVAVLTSVDNKPGEWLKKVENIANNLPELNTARKEHEKWWEQFWTRSWIYIEGDDDAFVVSRAYNLQRYVSACGGRGKYPIKFNGSIFTVDNRINTKKEGQPVSFDVNGDYRAWGGQYWFQNTRHMYWPMLMSGDFDMMHPFFGMYQGMTDKNKELVQKYYQVNGLLFAETCPFEGGIPKATPEEKGSYTKHYYAQILEYTAMALDYYGFTGDDDFARKTLIPIANEGLKFYFSYFKYGKDGKIAIDPANSMETFWKVRNPLHDIAGLYYVLSGLKKLPSHLIDRNMMKQWNAWEKCIPQIPYGAVDGHRVFLPAEDLYGDKRHNFENTDLSAVFPFRLCTIGEQDIQTGINTFERRSEKIIGCWHYDVVIAALLGLTDEAQKQIVSISRLKNARSKADNEMRFPVFWGPNHDYTPDQDHGGVLCTAIQYMLLQASNDKIYICPAFPEKWNVDFKLHTDKRTVVYATVKRGKTEQVETLPAKRKKDIVFHL